eukprot:5284173-Pleurochrysis_carterae.AAC.5
MEAASSTSGTRAIKFEPHGRAVFGILSLTIHRLLRTRQKKTELQPSAFMNHRILRVPAFS